jgi:hypothetical protein
MDHPSPSFQRAARSIRWVARALSIVIVIFWGFFLGAAVVASLTNTPPPPQARPGGPTVAEHISLILTAVGLIGLLAAWKWEQAGAIIVLVAYTGAVIAAPNMLGGPALLIPGTAILFLLSWWLHRQPPRAGSES